VLAGVVDDGLGRAISSLLGTHALPALRDAQASLCIK
jgi:hypothetical protein